MKPPTLAIVFVGFRAIVPPLIIRIRKKVFSALPPAWLHTISNATHALVRSSLICVSNQTLPRVFFHFIPPLCTLSFLASFKTISDDGRRGSLFSLSPTHVWNLKICVFDKLSTSLPSHVKMSSRFHFPIFPLWSGEFSPFDFTGCSV